MQGQKPTALRLAERLDKTCGKNVSAYLDDTGSQLSPTEAADKVQEFDGYAYELAGECAVTAQALDAGRAKGTPETNLCKRFQSVAAEIMSAASDVGGSPPFDRVSHH